ncbi:MAG: SDR family oxidoreductase [Paenibacillaceae bacterium]
MTIHNKIVFITDADSKSGKAILHQLVSEGAHFILNSPSNGEEIRLDLEQCHAAGSKTVVINIDLCNRSELDATLEQTAQQLGTVNVLVHNNNLVKPASVEYCEEDVFFEILNANTKTAFVCTQSIGKQMIAQQSGRIIYVSSIHAEKPTGSSFAYSASKGAVKLLASEAALFLGRHGITINTIEMGPVEGDNIAFESTFSSLYDSYEYKVPNAILGTYEDLASLVVYLASDESRYLNGAVIRLDGGFLNHYMDHRMKEPAVLEGGTP